jgi:hypothetical protein
MNLSFVYVFGWLQKHPGGKITREVFIPGTYIEIRDVPICKKEMIRVVPGIEPYVYTPTNADLFATDWKII